MTSPVNNKRTGVLILSAGRRVELADCFRSSFHELGIAPKVLAGDVDPAASTACICADKAFTLPRCTRQEYPLEVLRICRDEGVCLVIPTIDPELCNLCRHAEAFARDGILLNLSPLATVAMCRDKFETFRALSSSGVPVPQTAMLKDRETWRNWTCPVILKPIDGSASMGIHRCAGVGAIDVIEPMLVGDYVVQELVEGVECTVNCYYDKGGKLRCAVPHRRIEVRQGEVSKGETARVEAIDSTIRLMTGLPFVFTGVVCFQCIVSGGIAWVTEINARFGGGYPLAHHAGATFTRWLLEEALGLPCSAADNWRSGVTMLRYDQSVFVDNGVPTRHAAAK